MLCSPSCLYQASHSLTPALSPQPANLECSTEDKPIWLLCRSLRRRITNPNWCFLLHIWHQNIHCSFTTLPWCTDWHNFFPAPTPCCKKKKKVFKMSGILLWRPWQANTLHKSLYPDCWLKDLWAVRPLFARTTPWNWGREGLEWKSGLTQGLPYNYYTRDVGRSGLSYISIRRKIK